jgi:hypothetical protein
VPATTGDVSGATNGLHTALHEQLHGADIILVPNNDDAGYGFINKVGTVLINIVKRIGVLRLAPRRHAAAVRRRFERMRPLPQSHSAIKFT